MILQVLLWVLVAVNGKADWVMPIASVGDKNITTEGEYKKYSR